jgi:hypothetical protein
MHNNWRVIFFDCRWGDPHVFGIAIHRFFVKEDGYGAIDEWLVQTEYRNNIAPKSLWTKDGLPNVTCSGYWAKISFWSTYAENPIMTEVGPFTFATTAADEAVKMLLKQTPWKKLLE